MNPAEIDVPEDVAEFLREFFFDQAATMANVTGDFATKMVHAGRMQAAAHICQQLDVLTAEELGRHMGEVRRLNWLDED